MDHPLSLPAAGSEGVRPWRTATLVATAVAGLELVLLIVAGMILLGRSIAPQVHSAAAAHAAAAKKETPAAPGSGDAAPRRPVLAAAKLSRGQTAVLILNGNGVSGAAAQAAALVKARGYLVKAVGNAPRTGYETSRVMYRPGFEGEAKRFAKDLNVAQVGPLDGFRPAQLARRPARAHPRRDALALPAFHLRSRPVEQASGTAGRAVRVETVRAIEVVQRGPVAAGEELEGAERVPRARVLRLEADRLRDTARARHPRPRLQPPRRRAPAGGRPPTGSASVPTGRRRAPPAVSPAAIAS